MRRSLPLLEPTVVSTFGTCPKLARSNPLRIAKMVPRNFSLSTVATLPKYLTFHGTPTTRGLFAQFLRTTSCRLASHLLNDSTFQLKHLTFIFTSQVWQMAENIYNDEDNDGAADSDGKWGPCIWSFPNAFVSFILVCIIGWFNILYNKNNKLSKL